MTHRAGSDDREEQRSLLRIYVIAGSAIIIAMMTCLTIVVSEGQGDQLTRTVIALAPFISGAITLIGTGLGHRVLANKQTQTQSTVTELRQEQTDGVLSDRIDRVTRTVLSDPAIQGKIADRLGETLIRKAAQGAPVEVTIKPDNGKPQGRPSGN